jgi:His-Xaa-Ser system radical SAM maturase HxsC
MLAMGASGRPLSHWRSTVIGRVALSDVVADRQDYVRVIDRVGSTTDFEGYAAIVSRGIDMAAPTGLPVVTDVGDRCRWSPGDIVAVQPTGYIRTLYRIESRHNALFATDRCNSYCLMCSQPPKEVDESGRVNELLRIVDLMSPDTEELGVTGGEPTLLGDGLVSVVARCKQRLPRAALHVLSNGRLFRDAGLAEAFSQVNHPDLMFGIPLYSDLDDQHDYVVQAKGAFEETLLGLLNLARWGVPFEIRVVVHQHTYPRLFELAEFIYRNLTFAAHVTFMGLEPMGFGAANFESLWIDPWDYRFQLERAVGYLAVRGMRVSIYNHQLCTLPEGLWSFAVQSISDWKNEYLPVCDGCTARDKCSGFFASSIHRRVSAKIRPIL